MAPRRSGSHFTVLLQEELLEQKHPYKVEPADEYTAKGNDDADHQSNKTSLFRPSRPSDDDLCDPVDEGNDEQKELHQAALFVKPSHDMYLQKDLYYYFTIRK
jgi:hypothetical protein